MIAARIARWALVAGGAGCVAGCGDNLPADQLVVATSGSRISLHWYDYADGVRQPDASALYDKSLHAFCTTTLWIDGVARCVPVGEDAVYVDAACGRLVGRSVAIADPTYFVVHHRVAGSPVPAPL